MLILFYSRMFNQALPIPELPPEVEITEDTRRFSDADVVVFHLPEFPRRFFRRKRRGQIWVAWSMECLQHYPRLTRVRFQKRFDLHIGHRLSDEVFTSYIPDDFLDQYALPATHHQPGEFACSFISGDADAWGRLDYIEELAKYIDLHQYGSKGNRIIENDTGHDSKFEVMRKYRFNIAFENALSSDYVTEKFYQPLSCNCVPVYMGAPNISQLTPTDHCYINATRFDSPKSLANYLLQLSNSPSEYTTIREWQKQPLNPKFIEMHEVSKKNFIHRLITRLDELKLPQ